MLGSELMGLWVRCESARSDGTFQKFLLPPGVKFSSFLLELSFLSSFSIKLSNLVATPEKLFTLVLKSLLRLVTLLSLLSCYDTLVLKSLLSLTRSC